MPFWVHTADRFRFWFSLSRTLPCRAARARLRFAAAAACWRHTLSPYTPVPFRTCHRARTQFFCCTCSARRAAAHTTYGALCLPHLPPPFILTSAAAARRAYLYITAARTRAYLRYPCTFAHFLLVLLDPFGTITCRPTTPTPFPAAIPYIVTYIVPAYYLPAVPPYAFSSIRTCTQFIPLTPPSSLRLCGSLLPCGYLPYFRTCLVLPAAYLPCRFLQRRYTPFPACRVLTVACRVTTCYAATASPAWFPVRGCGLHFSPRHAALPIPFCRLPLLPATARCSSCTAVRLYRARCVLYAPAGFLLYRGSTAAPPTPCLAAYRALPALPLHYCLPAATTYHLPAPYILRCACIHYTLFCLRFPYTIPSFLLAIPAATYLPAATTTTGCILLPPIADLPRSLPTPATIPVSPCTPCVLWVLRSCDNVRDSVCYRRCIFPFPCCKLCATISRAPVICRQPYGCLPYAPPRTGCTRCAYRSLCLPWPFFISSHLLPVCCMLYYLCHFFLSCCTAVWYSRQHGSPLFNAQHVLCLALYNMLVRDGHTTALCTPSFPAMRACCARAA